MSYIIFLILLLLGAFGGFLAAHLGKKKLAASNPGRAYNDAKAQVLAGRVVAGVFIGVLVIVTLVASFNTVSTRQVGIVSSFGKIVSQTGQGVQLLAPWETLQTQSVAVNANTFDEAAFSRETQDVTLTVTLNWSVAPKNVLWLYRNVGPSFYSTIVPGRVAQAVKEQTVRYLAVDIAPHRQQLATAIQNQLSNSLGAYDIDVDGFQINNIQFSQAFTLAIEDKQIASQNAQAEQNRVAVARARAQQVEATAQGNAQATLINAEAQAKANQLLSNSLTPNLIQYTEITKLSPSIRTILLPSAGTNAILPSSVFTGATGK